METCLKYAFLLTNHSITLLKSICHIEVVPQPAFPILLGGLDTQSRDIKWDSILNALACMTLISSIQKILNPTLTLRNKLCSLNL